MSVTKKKQVAFNICYSEEIQAHLFSTHVKPNGCGQYTAVLPSESTDSQEAIITVGRKREMFDHTCQRLKSEPDDG